MNTKINPLRFIATFVLGALCSASLLGQVEHSSRSPLGLTRLEIGTADTDSKMAHFQEDGLVVTGVPGATKSRKGKQDVVVLAEFQQ